MPRRRGGGGPGPTRESDFRTHAFTHKGTTTRRVQGGLDDADQSIAVSGRREDAVGPDRLPDRRGVRPVPSLAAGCGDGNLEPPEQCDDGNLDPGDGCGPGCTIEICGNGILDFGEACDDGNASDNDNCLSDCVAASCGDGFVDQQGPQVERCDPPADTAPDCCVPHAGAGCADAVCEAAVCAVVAGGEEARESGV